MSSRAAAADTGTDGAAIRPGTFASLRVRNFRLFAAGLFVSGTGGWVQRIAQDWLVLDLTGSAAAVGITTACQFLPTLLIGLYAGVIADRFPRRLVLLTTQALLGLLATALSVLTITGAVEVWHVYLLALGLGTVAAFDNPCRQAFVNELVGPERIRNAIGLISSTFQLGALIGPLLSGVLIGAAGNGVAFAFNAATYGATITALLLVRPGELRRTVGRRAAPRLRDGLRYVVANPQVRWPVLLVGTFGVFISSLPVTLAAFADGVLHSGPGGYGLLNSLVACGSLIGALVSARRVRRNRLRTLVGIAALLALATMLAASAPTAWAFLPLLVSLGMATLLFLTTAQSMVQQTTPDELRGRVLGVYTLVFVGSGAIGSPVIGVVDEHLGPRAGLLLAAAIPAAVTLLVARRLAHDSHLRLRVSITLVPR